MKSKVLGCLGLLATSAIAWALVAAPQPLPMRVASADAVFIGRVIALEDKDIQLPNFPGAKQTTTYRVALVKVTDPISGVKDETVRVAFLAPPMLDPNVKRPIIISSGGRGPKLDPGLDGLFLLNKHPTGEGKIYQAPGFFNIVNRNSDKFDKEVAEVKTVVRALQNPKEGLEAKDANERLLTAAALLTKYRSRSAGKNPRQEPIAADESQLILKAIAEGNWPQQRRFDQIDSFSVFLMLNLTPKDGYTPAKGARTVEEQYKTAQSWLKDNQNKYRIQKWTAD